MFVENTASEISIPLIQKYPKLGKGENWWELRHGVRVGVILHLSVLHHLYHRLWGLAQISSIPFLVLKTRIVYVLFSYPHSYFLLLVPGTQNQCANGYLNVHALTASVASQFPDVILLFMLTQIYSPSNTHVYSVDSIMDHYGWNEFCSVFISLVLLSFSISALTEKFFSLLDH